MKKLKAVLAVLTAGMMMLTLSAVPASAEAAAKPVLQFNDDGKFTVMQIADMQDMTIPVRAMLVLMERAFAEIKPDLVVFSGDNISQPVGFLATASLEQALAPVAAAGIPYAYTFGNHDAEDNYSKDKHHAVYMNNGICMTYNADPAINGFGNCNLPILSSDGLDTAFNFWIIDSGMYHDDGGYDIVHPDQIEWYKNASDKLTADAGHKVPSIAFQHIIVPEIFDYLKQAPGKEDGTKFHDGHNAYFYNEFIDTAVLAPGAALNEFPCPPNFNTGELAAMAAQGDVLAIATGHDHVNSFILTTNEGIDLIQTPGISYTSYGDDSVRGFRTITIDESDTSTYDTETYLYSDFLSADEIKTLSKRSFMDILNSIIFTIKSMFLNSIFFAK